MLGLSSLVKLSGLCEFYVLINFEEPKLYFKATRHRQLKGGN